ncbi:MAG: hypothetical protein HC890_05790 [Chloroflexaceae bacterium]|nr:hypothetical protein [Chloroflexaceae bacterium]
MSNIKLTYQYTLDSIKIVTENIDKLNVRLGVVLTLAILLAGFGKDLPGFDLCVGLDTYPCLTCLLTKFSAYALIVVAIGLGLWGILPENGGKIVLPKQLLSPEWNQASEEDYLTALVQYLESETLLVLDPIRSRKSQRLQWGIWALGIAALLLGLDEILAIGLSNLQEICPHG